MSERSQFVDLIALKRILASTREFTDVFPFNDPHNTRARILRNGLLITGFNALENYLQIRADQIMGIIAKSKIPYNDFNDAFKELVTNKSLEGILNIHKFILPIDRIPFVEDKLHQVGQFRARKPKYTGLGFSPRGSNVLFNDINEFMSGLEIKGGWSTLSTICTAIGASQPSLSSNFKDFGRARNIAAHDSVSSIPQINLLSHLDTALFVGISFDIIVTHAATSYRNSTSISMAVANIASPTTNFRFLLEASGIWTERVGARTVSHSDKSTACSSILNRRPKMFTLVRDSRGIPIELL